MACHIVTRVYLLQKKKKKKKAFNDHVNLLEHLPAKGTHTNSTIKMHADIMENVKREHLFIMILGFNSHGLKQISYETKLSIISF